jgi:hypothetical protein
MALLNWGDRYEAEHGSPRVFLHRDCGGRITERRTCSKCGAEVTERDVEWRPGPGARAAA